MTDLEWARAFVGCKIEGTGYRFAETVDVLVNKLAQVREEAGANLKSRGATGEHRGSLKPKQGASLSPAGKQARPRDPKCHFPTGRKFIKKFSFLSDRKSDSAKILLDNSLVV